MSNTSLAAPILAVGLLSSLGVAAQSTQDQTGLTALIDRVGGGAAPTGAGIVVGQVEAPGPGYLPDPAHPEFLGKTFTPRSPNPTVSGHATGVGLQWFGLVSSLAPAIADVHCWDTSHYLGLGFLNGTTATLPVDVTPIKIFNNSWISAGFTPNKQLRKFDYAVNSQGLLYFNGVNNGAGALDVPLLSHMFNGIAVGRSDGQHRAGDTLATIDGPGRMKPELVAPAGATSFSTPLVASGAALLVETARTHPLLSINPNAERPDVIRAVLMASAEHRAGWTNNPSVAGSTRGMTNTPLDPLWGADELDVDHAHWILTGLEQLPATSAALAVDATHAGWALTDVAASSSRWWKFQVDGTKPFVSVVAAWNRDCPSPFSTYTMPDCDLELWYVDPINGPTSLVGASGVPYFADGNVQSTSPVDNVEHLYVEDLAPGEYLVELRRTSDALPDWNVAVAWELHCPTPVAYGTGKVSSIGSTPVLSAHGFANASVDDLELRVAQGVPGKNGLAFYGDAPANLPFMGGTLLVQPPIKRLPVVTLDAAGAVSLQFPLEPTMIGTTKCVQFWYRDPSHPDGFGIGLTNAVEMHVCY